MFVRGVVGEIEHNAGVIDNAPGQPGTPWHTCHVVIGSERVKFPHRADEAGTFVPRYSLAVPTEGDLVEVVVDLDLKQNPRSLLQPFRLDIVALECVVLTTADEREQERQLRSVNSSGSKRATKAG
jgi:hypothetical protein